MHLVGALSVAMGWWDDRFGSDGWYIEAVPSALIAAVLAPVALLLLAVLRGWQGPLLPVLAGLVAAAWAAVGLSAGMNGWWVWLPVPVGVMLIVAERFVMNTRPPRHPRMTTAAE